MPYEARNGLERRIFTRLRLGMKVKVSMRRRVLGIFRTRDLDMGGLFIETANLDLYPNDVVELEFPRAAGEGRVHRFQAKVIRHAQEGIGLMFDEHDERSLSALRDVMVDAMPAAIGCEAIEEGLFVQR